MLEPSRPIVRLNSASLVTAPDGSSLHLLARTKHASLCHGELKANTVSTAVMHKTVEELWYVLSGEGSFYCEALNAGAPFDIGDGTSFALPPRSVFQFKCTSEHSLRFVITTLPAWPGDHEIITASHAVWD